MKKLCGIYYLVDFDEKCRVVVMYVGQTRNLEKRIARHWRDQQIDFCAVFFDPCAPEELLERAAAAIAEFRPRSVADCADEAETYSKTQVVGSRAKDRPKPSSQSP